MARRELCLACRRPIAPWPTDYAGLELCTCQPDWGYWTAEFELVDWPTTPAPGKQAAKPH